MLKQIRCGIVALETGLYLELQILKR